MVFFIKSQWPGCFHTSIFLIMAANGKALMKTKAVAISTQLKVMQWRGLKTGPQISPRAILLAASDRCLAFGVSLECVCAYKLFSILYGL